MKQSICNRLGTGLLALGLVLALPAYAQMGGGMMDGQKGGAMMDGQKGGMKGNQKGGPGMMQMSGMMHDMSGMMTDMWAQMEGSKMSAEQQQECLENIHSSGRHLLGLVNDVLDLSKIEAGRLELQYEEFQLGPAIGEVLTVVRPLAERAQVALQVEVDHEDSLVRADKGKFKQVLYNLLANAIKFTPEGGYALVRARTKPRAGQLVLQVKDSGIGIDPQHHEEIFSEFFQVQSSADRPYEGTGLGLALVKRMVGLHGGTIKVESQLGKGATFTVTLPLHGLRPNGQLRNRILVIEDNPSSLELSTLVLRGQGFKVDTAMDGQEGLQKAKAHPYDLILMDIQLPGIDGLTVTRLLKADPRTSQTPIVALSARAMLGDEREAMEAGCSGYITKPIEVKSFVNTVTEYLEALGA